MRRELMATSIGRRASGEIPTVREAQDDGRSSTALEMARHAARDLLRQLDVRIAESRVRVVLLSCHMFVLQVILNFLCASSPSSCSRSQG